MTVKFETVRHGVDTPEEIRQKRINNDRMYCEYYAPRGSFFNNPCSIGCGRKPQLIPCVGGHLEDHPLEFCPKWERRSLERAEKRADQLQAAFARMTAIGSAVSEWRKSSPAPKEGDIDCPACGKGSIHLSQARNGHVVGKCTTEGCVTWIE